MIFGKKPDPEPINLSADAYRRWLRAHRPPFDWFLAQDEMQQEAMAREGDEHIADICIGIASAIVPDQKPVDEGSMLDRMIDSVASKLGKPSQPGVKIPTEPNPKNSLAGVGARFEQKEADRAAAKVGNRTLFGQKPDGVPK